MRTSPSFGLYLLAVAQSGARSSALPPAFASACLRPCPARAPSTPVEGRRTIVNWKRKRSWDPYETLAVSRNASPDDIKKAFYEMAKKYHPDTNRDPAAQAKFLKIKEAFELLKSPSRRAEWDRDGEVGEEMMAPLDPQIRWRKEKYGPNAEDDASAAESAALAQRRKIGGYVAIVVGIYITATLLFSGYGPQPERGMIDRAPYGKKLPRDDFRIDPHDAASVKAYNEARLPRRAFVVKDPMIYDEEQGTFKRMKADER
ncbi:DnaJ domain-containing protein [Hyaloraphidium curvatum]|nr:DnaJ domain-containing protein [Hyaloraphidium curvatum]